MADADSGDVHDPVSEAATAATLAVPPEAFRDAETAAERAYRRRWWILFAMCLSLVVITLDNTILNVAVPTIVRDLDATNSQLQWIIDAYTLVFAGLLLTAGAMGDRFGRRGALQIGLAIFGLGSLLSMFASDPAHLIATRGIMGVGGAFIMPATLSIITNVFPPKERGPAIGIWAGISGIGIALGPLAGGLLLEHFYWGSIFAVNVPIVIAAIALGFVIVPTSKDPTAPKLDLLGAVLSIVGLVVLLWGLIEAPTYGWTDGRILAAFGVAAVIIAAFILWERRVDEPMLDVRFFKNPRFTAASLSITLVFFALFGLTFMLTQYFQFVLGFSPLETGLRMLPFAITVMIFAPLSARFVHTFGTKIVVAGGLALVSIGLLLLTMPGPDASYVDILWRMIVMAVGMGLVMAPATDSVMGSLPLAKAGVGSAVNDTTRMVGGSLGVAVIGSVLSSVYTSQLTGPLDKTLATLPLSADQSEQLRDVSLDGLGQALSAAGELASNGATAAADALTSAAQNAFVDGMHIGAAIGAAVTLIAVFVAGIWLPARARSEDISAQEADRTSEFLADIE